MVISRVEGMIKCQSFNINISYHVHHDRWKNKRLSHKDKEYTMRGIQLFQYFMQNKTHIIDW